MNEKQRIIEVLEKEITNLEKEVLQNKVDIAEAFTRIENSLSGSELLPRDFSATFKDMSNLKAFSVTLRANEAKLEALIKSRIDIEKTYLEKLVRV